MNKYNFPEGYSMLQTLTFLTKRNHFEWLEKGFEQFGDTFSMGKSNKKMIFTQDPSFINHMFQKKYKDYDKPKLLVEEMPKFFGQGSFTYHNDEYWLRQRRFLQPSFHHEKLSILFKVMKKVIDEYMSTFPTGNAIDIYPLMNTLAIKLISKVLLNKNFTEEKLNEFSILFTELQDFFQKLLTPLSKKWWYKLSGHYRKNIMRGERLREIILTSIRQRKEEIGQRKEADVEEDGNMLDMLLETRYEDTNEPMTEEKLVDEVMIIFFGGHESSANALSWILYLLASHPEMLQKLTETTQNLTPEECIRNEFVKAVINEGMRLYPPLWGVPRVTVKDSVYENFKLPKNTVISSFIYGVHRNPTYWKNANKFQPERFLEENKDQMPKNAFYPFGTGPRICIGNNFAIGEMAMILQAITQNFSIEPVSEKPPQIDTDFPGLRPKKVILKINRK